MDPFSDITDEEIVPFLNSLGAETFNKSFEWMLKDPVFGSILKWLYYNLDQNNALNAREEYRYSELEKKKKLLSPEHLEEQLIVIDWNYPGIPFPDDKESLKYLELEISFQKEKLSLLEREKTTLDNLVERNELAKQDLSRELLQISAAQRNCVDDETRLKENCLSLSQEVEAITEEVVMVIADVLILYGNCGVDVETAKKFLAFGPFEAYQQSQVLFRSHFNLYCSRRFRKIQLDNISSDAELKQVFLEAKEIEHRLSDAVLAYIDSKAELCGELAKITQVEMFENIHSSQMLAASQKASSKTAVEMSEQEECVVQQQLQLAVKEFVDRRTKLVVDIAVRSALNVRDVARLKSKTRSFSRSVSCERSKTPQPNNNMRQSMARRALMMTRVLQQPERDLDLPRPVPKPALREIHQDLSWLQEICQSAQSLDSVLYYLVRHELRTVLDLKQFAMDLKDYLKEEQTAVCSRIDSMNKICNEQKISFNNVTQQDPILKYLSDILGIKQTNDIMVIVKSEHDLMNRIKELKASILEALRKKEMGINEFKKSTIPLLKYIYNGCTKQPNAHPRAIASLSHELKHEMDKTDKRVVETSGMFTSVKNGDKQNLRKLWQWFLTDQNKFLSVVKETQNKNF